MCSGADLRRWRVVTMAAVVMAAVSVGSLSARQTSAEAAPDVFSQAEITRALEAVRNDPNLATDRTIQTLQWVDSAKPSGTPAWFAWFAWVGGLFRWIEQSMRVLLWCGAVVLAALLVVYIARTVRRYGASTGEDTFVAPTHVRDLDIRPESLPTDIGIAARRLWDRGEHRPAMALLYRGMLSRLAHVHRVPIRDSSTEGDCLALAASHLAEDTRDYTSHLVMVWQRFVYGGQQVQAATVHGLCDDFASALNRISPVDSLERRGAL